MNPLSGLFAPLLALLSVATVAGPALDNRPLAKLVTTSGTRFEARLILGSATADPVGERQFRSFSEMARSARVAEKANQVRIEQRIIIRISPAPAPRPPFTLPLRDLRRSLFGGMPGDSGSSHIEERHMTQCVPAAGIAGVRVNGRSRLMLFMRDQRIVSANLEKNCNAQDFYSGFLVERSTDGMICAGRDKLLSRSGSNCALGKLRQVVAVDDE